MADRWQALVCDGTVRDAPPAHGRVIYKLTSGVRSIVHELTDGRAADLDRIRVLPTQFRRLLSSINVRAHVVGEDVHACAIETENIDYRYAEGGTSVSMTVTTLPEGISRRCVALSKALDLPRAGVDLMHDPDGQWWCFEANPSPAYSAYEQPTGMPNARSLARRLAGVTDPQT